MNRCSRVVGGGGGRGRRGETTLIELRHVKWFVIGSRLCCISCHVRILSLECGMERERDNENQQQSNQLEVSNTFLLPCIFRFIFFFSDFFSFSFFLVYEIE